MKKKKHLQLLILLFTIIYIPTGYALAQKSNYVVAVRQSLQNEDDWMHVAEVLIQNHKSSTLIFYDKTLTELLPNLRRLRPRYLCVIDKPVNINRDFVIEGNRLCRIIDDDIYDDYLWGIVTGYTAKDALRVAQQSMQPLIIKSALSSTAEVKSGIWFDKIAWFDDGIKGQWGEKITPYDNTTLHHVDKLFKLLPIFKTKWEEIDPDLVLTSSHATQKNLEMPFSSGNIKSKNGKLYADFIMPQFMPSTKKPRVYFPVGNCLIGDMNNTRESMAAAWISSGGATAMLAYVVPTWYGRNGWGALKYWISSPGKFTLAQASFLNRQDMLTQEKRKNPLFLTVSSDFKTYGDDAKTGIEEKLQQLMPDSFNKDDVGFIYDRDVVVYYGDPAWDVRLKNIPEYDGYEINFEKKSKQYIITLQTKNNFSIDKTSGKGFKEEHVGAIPIAYFFPNRIMQPKLLSNEANLDIAFDENFLLIYEKNLEPNKTYKIILE